MSENRRMLSRVVANYIGLIANLLIGIFLVRELIRVLGEDGFGLVSLFGMTVGVGIMIQDIVRQTMIRELGYAYHHEESDFKYVQASAFGVVGVVAFVSVLLFAGFWASAPLFSIPEELVGPGRWFIVAKALQCIVFILAAPLFNLFIVTERMVWANTLIVAERVMLLASILAVGYLSDDDLGQRIVVYGFASAAAASLSYLVGAVVIAVIDPLARPRVSRLDRAGVASMFRNSMLQGTAITAVNLHVRVDAFIVNVFAGLAANTVYGLALQFASYIRRVAAGMTQGLDAVATRFSAGSTEQDVRWLVRRSTQMHAFVIFPIAAFAMLFASSLIELWVGDVLEQSSSVEHLLIPTVLVLAVGISARALSDAWIHILYGAGKIKAYLGPVVIASVLNPILAIALTMILPSRWVALGPPIAMSVVFLAIHCGWIGRIALRELGATSRDLVTPVIGPAIGTAVALSATIACMQWFVLGDLIQILVGGPIFGAVYLAVCYFGVLNSAQRAMLLQRIRRRRPS
jgi:O-antigen/teichoic acid export membrane protein